MHASLRLQNETFTQSLEYENEILQSNTFTKHIGGQLGIDEHCVPNHCIHTLFTFSQNHNIHHQMDLNKGLQ